MERTLQGDIETIHSLKDEAIPMQIKETIRLMQTAPNDVAVNNAIAIIKEVYNFSFAPQRIFPAGGLKGGIGFMYYDNEKDPTKFAMFEMVNDGEVWTGYMSSGEDYLNKCDLNQRDSVRADILKLKSFIS